MYIFIRFFNNVIIMLVNFLIAIYYGRRFFLLMTNHYKLAAEIMEFNAIVREARASLDYTTKKIADVMKEMESDIGQELYMTHNLTKLSTKVALLLKRYSEVEERVLELVRMNDNMENMKIETPKDIKSEVKKILKLKKSHQLQAIKTLPTNNENPLTG